MKTKEIKDIRDLDFSTIKSSGFIDMNRLATALDQLKELSEILGEMININESRTLPQQLASKIDKFNSDILHFTNQIEQSEKGTPDIIAKKKDQYLTNIKKYYDQCFRIGHQDNPNKLIEYYSIVKSFGQSNNKLNKEIENLKNSYSDNIVESKKGLEELKRHSSESKTILNELKKKTSNQTVSDYAIVFEETAGKYKTLSENWFKSGIILSIIFVILVLIVSFCKILSTEILAENGDFIRYNLSNLFTKILIVAVLIFLMSFSFKQYSINKHLQTLNTHRQNALNSYQLFTKSIVGEDENSQNALMIQVAKAIYENTQSTGFLNEKNQNVNSGIVELTKIIGKNSTI